MDKLKTKVQNIDWWEIGYLILYGAIFTYSFLDTTMFEIQWPPRFGYIFLIASALFTAAKFIWHNTYTKKEMIWAAIILGSFIISGIVADYSFLIWTGFLIVGAKDVDFDKILRVYLTIGISIMVIAFAASQYGYIEDLQYILYRDGVDHIRHSYGIVYPTDFAAHIFYFVVIISVYFEKKLSVIEKVWICILAAILVYFVSNAQTSTLCLIGYAGLCIFECVFRKYMHIIEKVFRWIPSICAITFFALVHAYNPQNLWVLELDSKLSGRLGLSKEGFVEYGVKLFGQYIPEQGNGTSIIHREDYFFLDDAYVRILLEYGIVLFVIVLLMLVLLSRRAVSEKKYTIVIAIVAIAVHSFMEHHLLEVAYNPLFIALLASWNQNDDTNRREKCIEEKVIVG